MTNTVLMLGWEFPPNISGGLGTACYGLTKGLLHCGMKIHFLLPKVFGNEDASIDLVNASDVQIPELEELFSTFGVKLNYESIDSSLIPYATPEEYDIYLSGLKKRPLEDENYEFSGAYGQNIFEEVHRYAHVAAKVSKTKEFDIIHAHDWLTYPAGIMVKDLSGKPLVIHVHATEFDRSGETVNQMVYDIERLGMEKADRIIAVSELTKRIIVERYGINGDKVEVVYNAIQKELPPRYDSNLPNKIVSFLGRVTFQKGPDYFVEAAWRVLNKMRNVHFVMAGSGDMLEKLIHRAGQLNILSNFHFTGFLNKSEVDRLLSASSLYVMPSVSEPFGISALEAMKADVPVIISRQSGVSETLQNAIKVDFWDIDELSNAIYGILQYSSLSNNLRNSGKEEIKDFDWDKTAQIVCDLYRKMV